LPELKPEKTNIGGFARFLATHSRGEIIKRVKTALAQNSEEYVAVHLPPNDPLIHPGDHAYGSGKGEG
jgi:hypothetical protein